ncbi:MAG: N-acetyl-gamma-glutamyl-phosphate reductase [Bacteroidetes bacterium]|uniref:N-acetyl-gamma-glutamyl-phosphate reductase n=1 Tax=Phnomibacter sp. TaxID=2836217 RepID=UPI002FDEAA0A|nr:N-acetyl-gamma-glutamyl-phosphate reductase [Bacteroidota bacterium]
MKIRAGIIGGAGYTGGELIRLLINHPQVELSFVQSGSNAGNPLHQVHADLLGDTEQTFAATHHFDIDVLFFCAGHGEAKKFVQANDIPASVKLIDIGNDFRLHADAVQGERTFIYGLPELNKEQISNAQNIANPGCFATAIQLGLLPLAKAGLLTEVYTTGITGSTGAGQSLSATSHFSWRANNIQAYKTLTHQHLGEITESLQQLQPTFSSPTGGGREGAINFVPWRGDFTRGIFISSTLPCDLELPEAYSMYESFYAGAAFTHVTRSAVFLKQVVNSNKCIIQLEKIGNKLVVHSVIDNLLKGASGQAVQNMNLLFGLAEKTGLNLKATYF